MYFLGVRNKMLSVQINLKQRDSNGKLSILYIDPQSARYRILVFLSKCRGYRTYSSSLLSCLDGDDMSERRVHNTCVTLFKHGLVEKVRGMYQLTPAGLDLVVG